MRDLTLSNLELLCQLVEAENWRQIDKWDAQDVTPFEWLTYAVEEVGEMSKAISEYEYRNGAAYDVVTESIQAATLILKIAEMYYFEPSTKGKKPPIKTWGDKVAALKGNNVEVRTESTQKDYFYGYQ